MPEPTLFTKMLAQEANRLFKELEGEALPDHGFDRITFSRMQIRDSIYPNNRSIGFFVPREAFERSLYAFSQQWLRLPIQWLRYELKGQKTIPIEGLVQIPTGVDCWIVDNVRLIISRAPWEQVSEKSLPVIGSWFQQEEYYNIFTDEIKQTPVCPVVILTIVVEDNETDR